MRIGCVYSFNGFECLPLPVYQCGGPASSIFTCPGFLRCYCPWLGSFAVHVTLVYTYLPYCEIASYTPGT